MIDACTLRISRRCGFVRESKPLAKQNAKPEASSFLHQGSRQTQHNACQETAVKLTAAVTEDMQLEDVVVQDRSEDQQVEDLEVEEGSEQGDSEGGEQDAEAVGESQVVDAPLPMSAPRSDGTEADNRGTV